MTTAKEFIHQQLAATGFAPINHELAKLLCPDVVNEFRDFIAWQNTPSALLTTFKRTALCRARIEDFGDMLILYRGPLVLAERIGMIVGGAVELVDGDEAAAKEARTVTPAPGTSDQFALLHADVETKEPPRPCKRCGRLSSGQTCLAAIRHEIEGAPIDYRPDVAWPRRCLSFTPPHGTHDDRNGRELWPEITQ